MSSQRQECIQNCKSTADLELYEKIAKFGNERLGHMWDFTADEVFRVMCAVILYCIEKGEDPKEKELLDISFKTLSWTEADGAIKVTTHTT